MEIHLFFVKVIIIISELELFLTFQGLIFGSSLLSFEVKKVKALHFFLLKSIKEALLNQEKTTCCFNARKYFS